jgi:hypothetical protein
MFPASYRISREYAMTTNGTKKTQEIPTVIQVGHPFSVFPFRGKIPMAIKPQSMYPPSAPSAPLLRDAIATLTLKIGGAPTQSSRASFQPGCALSRPRSTENARCVSTAASDHTVHHALQHSRHFRCTGHTDCC